jgi:hypothetical protein
VSNFCFATLALGFPYHEMAVKLAGDLSISSPDKQLFIVTDAPSRFSDCANVRARFHLRTGLFHCLNDKRFAVSWALAEADRAVFLDADTRIEGRLPATLDMTTPLTTVYTPNLLDQAKNYLLPRDREAVLKTARAFGIEPSKAWFVWDNIFAVGNDAGREHIFFATWELVTRALDFQGVPITDGYCMSIAAAVTGWRPAELGLESISAACKHTGVSAIKRTEQPPLRAIRKLEQWYRWRKYRIHTISKISSASSQ